MEDQSPNQTSTLPKAPPVSAEEATSNSTLPSAPDSWPGAFGAYKYSKEAVKVNLLNIVVVWLVVIAINILADRVLGDPGQVVSLIAGVIGGVAYTALYIRGVRRQKMTIGDALKLGLTLFVPALLLTLLLMVSIVASLLALVIPFFFVLPRLMVAEYFLVDKKMGVMDSFKASWNITKGNVKKVYGIIGASILMFLPALTIIGIPFTIYWLLMYSGAWAVLYEYLTKQAGEIPVTNPVPNTESAV